MTGSLVVALIVVAVVGLSLFGRFQGRRREAFVRSYIVPASVLEGFAKHHRKIDAAGREQVARALRQFFLVRLHAGVRSIAMPSRAVDDLWHEFILDTREYERFCKTAFGQFFHHVPAAANPPANNMDVALRRTWRHACLIEGILGAKPSRLPLLFAIDTELQIPEGQSFLNWLTAPPKPLTADSGCTGSGCTGGHGGSGCGGHGSCGGH